MSGYDGGAPTGPREAERAFRPSAPAGAPLGELVASLAGLERAPGTGTAPAAPATGPALHGDPAVVVRGVCLDSRGVQPGDLYAAVPGANAHGAQFAAQAAEAGAAAILTDSAGAGRALATGLPVVVADPVRAVVGPAAAVVFGTSPGSPELFGVTGTNGKTTTTYFLRSLLRALGRTTGLVGTIEIVAGETRIPSVLTTPEAPQLHALFARMRESGVQAAAMEVSSHSIDYGRIAGLRFAVAGFTNLTQDHLDLHGTMEEYFDSKARLFEAGRTERAVVLVDDEWGRRMARRSGAETWTLRTVPAAGTTPAGQPAGAEPAGAQPTGAETAGSAHWSVAAVLPDALGHRFELHGPGGAVLRARTGLPGLFNVSNAALAVLMVHAGGVALDDLQQALDAADPLTVDVPGRMQVVCERPAAVVDFAHNPDALERAIAAVRSPDPGSRVVVVFGATGQRDATKRPVMGAIAARGADVVVVTDDDPHDEEPSGIRAAVLAGAQAAVAEEGLSTEVVEVFPRAEAIAAAVRLARPVDTILVAGRGHEVWQEVSGVNLALDDRVELRNALAEAGHLPTDSTDHDGRE